MPSLREYVRKYITGLNEEQTSKVVSTVAMQADSNLSRSDLSPVKADMLRKIALREPMFFKATSKKNKDTLRNWFELKTVDKNVKIQNTVNLLIQNFEKRTNLKNKLFIAGMCANIYGTGFIERTFMESDSIKADVAPNPDAKPLGINLLNSEFITKKQKHPTKKDGLLYWVYEENMADPRFIHPNRIIPVIIDSLPHSYFGISKVDILMNILHSKMDADVSSGEILSWFGHGILDITINGMQDEQQQAMIKVAQKHPWFYLHNEDYKLEVKNPNRIDPKPFYDYFFTNIASAFEMPTHMLTGEQLGNVTGSEIGVSEYYHDVENIQTLVFTPIIETIYKQLLSSNGKRWNYNIDWNPIFVNELSEADILQKRSYSATANSAAGIISIPEARQILNEGVAILDVNKVPEQPKPVAQPVSDPNIAPQDPKKPTVKNILIPLTPKQQAMIEAEKLRGKIEMEEQERRCKEAEKRLKKGK